MKNAIVILTLLCSISLLTMARTSHFEKYTEANCALHQRHCTGGCPKALQLFKELYAEVDRKDSLYPYVVSGLAMSMVFTIYDKGGLSYMMSDRREHNDWKGIIDLSNEYFKLAEDNKDVPLPSELLLATDYPLYGILITAYFGLGEYDKAKPYQQKLYDAHKNKQIPKYCGYKHGYDLETFVYSNLNVKGYEWFEIHHDKDRMWSDFSKQTYSIWSRNKKGGNKHWLFTLEVTKADKLKTNSDFILIKKSKRLVWEKSEIIGGYTFSDPVDYAKLHNAIVEALQKEGKTNK